MATLRYIGFGWQDVGARRWMLEDAHLLARGGVCSEDTHVNGTPFDHWASLSPEEWSLRAVITDLKVVFIVQNSLQTCVLLAP